MAVVVGFAMKIVRVTPFMLLLLNISIADIVIGLNAYPMLYVEPSQYKNAPTPIASFICAVVDKSVFAYSSVVVNALTLIYISFMRVASFNRNARGQRWLTRLNVVKVFVCFSWLVGIGAFISHYFKFTIDPVSGMCRHHDNTSYHITSAVGATTMLLCTLIVLLLNFIRTTRTMWHASNLGNASAIAKQRKEISGMLLGLAVAFFLLNTPLTVYFVIRGTGYFESVNDITTKRNENRLYLPVVVIAMLNTWSDPILYAFSWKSFRSGFTDSMRTFMSENSVAPSRLPTEMSRDAKSMTAR